MLNPKYLKHIQQQIPETELADFITFSQRPLRKSIRVNTIKISIADFKDLVHKQGWELEPIPWCKSGFWLQRPESQEQNIQLGNTPEHKLGLMYIQEASSMLPAEILMQNYLRTHDEFPQLILDMASAPGSKTSQLAALCEQSSLLIANELSSSRLKTLAHNLNRSGLYNYVLTHKDAREFADIKESEFDAILLDAPCTGEGTIRKDVHALDNWQKNNIVQMAELQKQLIAAAFTALKPGGFLVYSTCTLSREENESVFKEILKTHGNQLKSISLENAFPDANRSLSDEGSLKILPHHFDSEGFYVACLQKNHIQPNQEKPSDSNFSNIKPSGYWELADRALLSTWTDYLTNHFGFDASYLQGQFIIKNEKHGKVLWLFPTNLNHHLFVALKPNRCGIRLCDIFSKGKKWQFRISHEMASSFGHLFTEHSLEISLQQLQNFLHGQDLQSQHAVKGDVVLTYQGQIAGLARGIGTRLKNNLPRDLIAPSRAPIYLQ